MKSQTHQGSVASQSIFDSAVVYVRIYWPHLAPSDMLKVALGGTMVSPLASELTKYFTYLSSPLLFFSLELAEFFSKSTPSNSDFKKASIALFFVILGKHSGSGQRFWCIFSQKGISQKLAHKDLFIGSLRYCFHALKCIPGIWLTSQNGLVKLLSLFVRDCKQKQPKSVGKYSAPKCALCLTSSAAEKNVTPFLIRKWPN